MEVRSFTLGEEHREPLEQLIYQLSGRQRAMQLETHPHTHCIGAFDEGILVGFAQLFVLHKTTQTLGHVEDVVINESYRGQGLGKRMIETLLAVARSEGCATVSLTSQAKREAAHALYHSLGFVVRDTTVFRLTIQE